MPPRLALAALLAVLSACGMRYWRCDDVPPAALQSVPATLSATNLFTDASEQLSEGVLAYRPSFELWSDGASKRRWLSLPRGTRIDTSDMDAWSFPQGTKIWKEFSRDGVRVETRLLYKRGPSDRDWVAVSYVWRVDGTDADLAPLGAINARGTAHDVPAADQCMGCHGGRKGRVLGIAALQLAHPARPGEVALKELEERGLLSNAPSRSLSLPGNEEQRAALGYLYANCAHCHNQTRPAQEGRRCYDPRRTFDLSISTQSLGSLANLPVYRTGGTVFTPGAPAESELLQRMSKRGLGAMPPLASETVDARGVELMRAWIAHPR